MSGGVRADLAGSRIDLQRWPEASVADPSSREGALARRAAAPTGTREPWSATTAEAVGESEGNAGLPGGGSVGASIALPVREGRTRGERGFSLE